MNIWICSPDPGVRGFITKWFAMRQGKTMVVTQMPELGVYGEVIRVRMPPNVDGLTAAVLQDDGSTYMIAFQPLPQIVEKKGVAG